MMQSVRRCAYKLENVVRSIDHRGLVTSLEQGQLQAVGFLAAVESYMDATLPPVTAPVGATRPGQIIDLGERRGKAAPSS